jgi:hypothetical protein
LPVTVSCDDARSLVEVPQGLMYAGGGTIWLLPRGFAPPVPVGDAISQTLEQYTNFFSALVTYGSGLDGTARCVHFTLCVDDTDGNQPIVAVYDLELGTWSIDEIGGPLLGSMAAIGGDYCWAAAGWDNAAAEFPLRRLSAAEAQDYDETAAPMWIESRIELGDLRPFGAIGWGRISKVQLFGVEQGACSMGLFMTMNEGNTTFTSTVFPGSLPGTSWYREHGFESTPCCSLQLTLRDAIAPGEGAVPTAGIGFRFLALELQPEAGLRRVNPDTERF